MLMWGQPPSAVRPGETRLQLPLKTCLSRTPVPKASLKIARHFQWRVASEYDYLCRRSLGRSLIVSGNCGRDDPLQAAKRR
jgi:hypothetical protein